MNCQGGRHTPSSNRGCWTGCTSGCVSILPLEARCALPNTPLKLTRRVGELDSSPARRRLAAFPPIIGPCSHTRTLRRVGGLRNPAGAGDSAAFRLAETRESHELVLHQPALWRRGLLRGACRGARRILLPRGAGAGNPGGPALRPARRGPARCSPDADAAALPP